MFQHLYITVISFLQRLVTGATLQPAVVPVRRSRRAATFIEYALLASVALILVVIFRTQLSSIFTSLMNNLRGAIG